MKLIRSGSNIAYGCRFCVALFLSLLLHSGSVLAQEKEVERPRNLRVTKEYSDGKGNVIREVQYNQGNMRVTETIIMPKIFNVGYKSPIDPDTMRKDMVHIVVDKTKYCVMVFYGKRMIRNYKAVFGPNPQANKCMEGDRCTPEGYFKISNLNPGSKYTKFMLLSYPNDSSRARFNQLKKEGKIPHSARIGGDIGIHGIWKGGDDMIEMGVGWTDGCVALKNNDIEELYRMVGIGTRVRIKK
jgi:murein L,D-transpeptidase YafK